MDETIIKIENAALKLKKFMIKPANLEIPKGYIVGVQGENGAGKTTLLHMMLGMYDKMKGKIYIDGLDVVKNKTKVKELVGIVSQDRKFYLSQDANGNEKIYSPFYKNWDSEEYHRMLAHLDAFSKTQIVLVFYRRNDKVSVCICGSIQTQSASDWMSRLPISTRCSGMIS